MTQDLLELLEAVAAGEIAPDVAHERIASSPVLQLDSARLDVDRSLRNGVPEVIFGEGKSVPALLEIVQALLENDQRVLVTRVRAEQGSELREAFPTGRLHAEAALFQVGRPHESSGRQVTVLSAGTSDFPVAEESALCLEWFGHRVERCYDVGVAGLHRLLDCQPLLRSADAVVVAAGMDGALPTVVAGLVRSPVISVPTSVGYGAAFDGLAALLTMLTACAPGVAVVNIDNGFGAAALAHRVLLGRAS